MQKSELKTTVKEAVVANEKSLIQSIKDAVRSANLNDSQLKAIREVAAKVGIKSFKDISRVSKVPAKNPLEKFILMRMAQMDLGASADFITKIVGSKTQDELAEALGGLSALQLEKLIPSPKLSEILTSLFLKFLITTFISACFAFIFKFVSSLNIVQKAMEGCRKFVRLGSVNKRADKNLGEQPNINTEMVEKIYLKPEAHPDFNMIDSRTQVGVKQIIQQADLDIDVAKSHAEAVAAKVQEEMEEARNRLMDIGRKSPDALPIARDEFNKVLKNLEVAQTAQKKITEIQKQIADLTKNYDSTPNFGQKYNLLGGQLKEVESELSNLQKAWSDAQVNSFHTALADRGGEGAVSFEFLDPRLKTKVQGVLGDSLKAAEKTQEIMEQKQQAASVAYNNAMKDYRDWIKENRTAPQPEMVKAIGKLNQTYAETTKTLEEAKAITEELRAGVTNPSLKAFNEARDLAMTSSDKLRVLRENADKIIDTEALEARIAINPTNTPEGFQFLSEGEQSSVKKGLDEVFRRAQGARDSLMEKLPNATKRLEAAEAYVKRFPDSQAAQDNLEAVKAMKAELELKITESDVLIQQAKNSRDMPSVVGLDAAKAKMDSYTREVNTLIEDQHKRYQELATTSATSYQQQQDSVSLRTDLKNETAFLLALKKDSPADFAEQIGISRDYTLGMDYAMQQIGDDPAVWAKVFEANPDLDPLMYQGMGNYGTPEIDVAELRKLYQDTEDLMYDGGLPTEAAALREEAERAKAFEKEYSQVKDKASFNLLCGAVQWAGFSYLKVFVTYIGKLAGGLAKEYLLQGALPAFITATAVSVLVLGKGVLSTILGLMAKGVGFVVDMAGSLWDKITGKSSTKLASRRDKLGQKKYASVALDLDIDTSNPDELVNLTSKGIMEVVKDKLKEVKKYLSGRTVESMRSLAEDIGLSTFNKVAQGEEVNPKTPLEKLIYEKVHGAGSAQEKLEFLSDITQAGSREEIQMLLGISDEEVDVYFSEAGSRGQKLKKYTIVFGSAFLLSLFVYAIAASGVFATATASLMATMKPIALYMHSVLGYQSAVAFYSTLALSAVKSGLISTTIFGIITYGPSWIRKSLGAIASWVGNKISSVWSVIKKGLSYLNPMRYLKKASGVRTRGEALLAIVSLPKEVYRGALIRGM